MKLYSENDNYKLYEGSMLDMLEVIEPNTIDSIVTDPPYELNFMGKGWDNSGIAFQSDTWKKCYEVLKPGGYLLAFGGSRTFHRIACAIEDAGFEIRDTIMWLYGSGFPKSMNIGKAIEGKLTIGSANVRDIKKLDGEKTSVTCGFNRTGKETGYRDKEYEMIKNDVIYHTELGKYWQGWGTALKPSFEPIIVARKPFKGSLVDNVIEYGVGGINIDECRVGNEHFEIKNGDYDNNENQSCFGNIKRTPKEYNGRFPANTILTYDETDFDEVCGGFPNTKSGIAVRHNSGGNTFGGNNKKPPMEDLGYADSGSASRYFYCAKASKKDRDEGLDNFNEEKVNDGRQKEIDNAFQRGETLRKNTHPTVKPTSLMQYLVRLVTPNGGTILDPFNGSGSTGKAVMYENKERGKNYKYIGIELTEEYLPIAKARIEYVCNLIEEDKLKDKQLSVFDIDVDIN